MLLYFIQITLSCARSVLPRPQANIPQYGPRARLVRGQYFRSRAIGLNASRGRLLYLKIIISLG